MGPDRALGVAAHYAPPLWSFQSNNAFENPIGVTAFLDDRER